MKLNRPALLTAFLFISIAILAQEKQALVLRSGPQATESNIRSSYIDSFNTRLPRITDKGFVVIRFNTIPDEATRKTLSAKGIQLLEYLSSNSYTATVSGKLKTETLQLANARSIIELKPEQKMDGRLAKGELPPTAVKIQGTIDVWVSFPKSFSVNEVTSSLKEQNAQILSTEYISYQILELRVAANRLTTIASLPVVEYMQPAPGGDQLLNYNSRYGSRANLLNASIADGGKGLNGEGIVIGVGDNADVQTHIDFSGRLVDRAAQPTYNGHGHHTTGTVGGAGNGNPLYRGYAPKALIVSQTFNGIILNAPAYVADYGMVITNNSYGDNIECGYYGTYDLYSRLLDQMAIDLPNLQNVFSAGNSGLNVCTPNQPGFHTVLGGYQTAKNVISVGATTDSGAISTFSSRGPVNDGRTKPEVVAMGQRVASTWAGNIYGYNNGTSMAGPAVSGGLALLYQRYRQLNAGANPRNGLMKAVLLNGATDRGNAGVDYQYGYGWINLLRSIDMIENNHYFSSSVTTGAANNHTITVPANTAMVKVMLYWNDPAASPLSAHNLVNDLDLEVTDPSATTNLPKVLDTTIAGAGNVAVTGTDHINNNEQVVINNPAAGSYTLKVKGTAINQNPSQEYFLVYDIVPVQLKITAPAGGEGLAPSSEIGDMMKINWEAYGYSSGTVTLELSLNNGASWSTIASNIDVNRAVYSWWVPNVATSQALVRITKDGSGETTTSNSFTIMGQPVVTLDPIQCEGYIKMNWNAVAGVDDYQVMMLKGQEMTAVATTTGTSYTFSGLSKDSTYYVSVLPRINGKAGRRAVAIARQPNSGTCAGSISDNDLKIDQVLSPSSGRMFTSTQLTANTVISVRVKNLDDAPATNFNLKYSINGGSFVTENVATTIAAGGTYVYNFSTTADLSAVANYNLVIVVQNTTPDLVTANDSAFLQVKNLDNQPLNLTSYFVDDIESATNSIYQRDTMGLTGIDRYDYTRSSNYGRLRSFVNTGIAYSGSKALTLDIDRLDPIGNTNFLTGTYNLVNYNSSANDIRLDFRLLNHGAKANINNKVWVRGDDSQAWVPVYDIDANEDEPGHYKKTESIEVSDLLLANGQSFGTSFQVKWGQYGQIAAVDKENAGGYSLDDIRLYEVFNDMQMLSINAPIAASCGLTSSSTIKITVRNSANTALVNVPVKYRVNNGAWVSETIPSVPGNTAIPYTFSTGADLSALGNYTIQTLVDYGSDSFRDNDTASIKIINTPVISTFPYLQNFEGSDGYWYTGGKNNSWEYGTPASPKINRAASGARAWKTRLTGNYNDNELSYLYSPCFNLTGMTNPTLSFSVALDLEDCGALPCDGAWVEYSADGISWVKLGAAGSGTNWYNKNSDQLWSVQNYTRWHVATTALPVGLTRMRLRIVMSSDEAADREGIAIDDIHVYDNLQGIYDGVTLGAPITQTVSGNSWIDFSSSGKLVASIMPNNQVMGSTGVQVYINNGPVRFNAAQYYHDRNITIKPTNTSLSDSVTVRFYFLDTETDTLIKATGCATCTKPASAYELGVSKYSDPDDNFENGTTSDNLQGVWTYILPPAVTLVPFDKGYYAEFRVKDFSEFWLNNGGFDHSAPLPVKLIDFTVQKASVNDVLVQWKVGSETDVLRYEIELAKGNTELQAGHFVKVGETASLGNTIATRNYSYTDKEADKFGARYYRLKIINVDGSFSYSNIRSVVYDQAVLWSIYPNPSSGSFNLVYQLDPGTELSARIVDEKGSLVKEYHKTGNGFVQKLNLDLAGMAGGVYLLQVETGGKKQSFKLYKQ